MVAVSLHLYTLSIIDRSNPESFNIGGQRSGEKVGRGSDNKIPFVAAIETNEEGHPLRAVFSPVIGFHK
ncbi:MAG: hypothetical protein EHM79_14755 [Geobacter sp.]|nr:MAG: hypothetical protein EHM79_14755 [Geobacter sp.]